MQAQLSHGSAHARVMVGSVCAHATARATTPITISLAAHPPPMMGVIQLRLGVAFGISTTSKLS